MKTKHIFVAFLDIGEILPFAIRDKKTVAESMAEQERAKKEMVRFIDALEKKYGEPIYYMGMDIIEAKNYERFVFESHGFAEIMVTSPLAFNAHFVNERRAKKFCGALKSALSSMLKKGKMSEMFVNSIEVNSEEDQSLTYERWGKVKAIKGTE